MTEIKCPDCGDTEIGTVERIIGIAVLSGMDESGDLVYEGTTEIDWNSQVTVKDDKGRPVLQCQSCFCQWGFGEGN